MSQTFNISSVWADDPQVPDEIGKRVLETLRRLEPVAPVMRNWYFLDSPSARGIPLAQAEPQMAALVERNVRRDDFGEPEEARGYGMYVYGWEVPETWDARTVHIDIHSGSKWSNGIDFEIGGHSFPGDPPRATDFSVVTYPVFKGALEVFAAVWPLPWALAYTFDIDARPRRASPFGGAWIAYLSAALTNGLVVPSELSTQSTPGGGLVLSALDTPIDQMNPDHMRRSRILERIMLECVGVGGADRIHRPTHSPRAGPY